MILGMNTERRTVMCRYQGKIQAETRGCKTCGPRTKLKTFACQNDNRKGEIVSWVDCQTCPHYAVAGLPLEDATKPVTAPSVAENEAILEDAGKAAWKAATGDRSISPTEISSVTTKQ